MLINPRYLWWKTCCGLELAGSLPLRLGGLMRSTAHFARLKDKYRGRRGFVIGNGPSLQLDDLERLTHEITIASNKIYLAFEQVRWRPTCYTVIDHLLCQKIGDEAPRYVDVIHTNVGNAKFFRAGRIVTWRERGNVTGTGPEPQFSGDLRRGVYGGYTISYPNLQLAVHLGLNPIYLLGFDHDYRNEKNVREAQPLEAHGQNHFVKGYRKPEEIVNPAPLDLMNTAFCEARRYGELHGIRFYNATRGGHLEAFERTDFDALFGGG